MYRVELICHHQPHKCRCRHNPSTEVNQQDLTSNLIKYNPSLLKYLGKYQQIQSNFTQQTRQREDKTVQTNQQNQSYRSIAEQKGLKYILNDNYVKQSGKEEKKESIIEQKIITSPRSIPQQPIQQVQVKNKKKLKQKHPIRSTKQNQLKKFHKDLIQQSRYLSDTGFRKYFNRQCFENYGRNNTTDKADGFIYGNYLKSFNINPHSGQNMPMNQETFYHALISASPDKYALYTQQVKLGATKEKQMQKINEEGQYFQKSRLNVQKMLDDNIQFNRLQNKYDHLRLKSPDKIEQNYLSPKNNQNNKQINMNMNGGSDNQKYNAQNIKTTSNNQRQNIATGNIKPQFVEQRRQSNNNNEKSIPAINSISCNHSSNQQSIQCECCINQMKRMMIDLAQRDPDLASRILSSAQKTVLYKNYSLNNYENAAKNPHNYRNNDGKLNIYER